MKTLCVIIIAFLPLVSFAAADVHIITIDGSINPVSAKFLEDAIARAEQAVDIPIVQMDTPGGLLASTRWMVQEMLPAEVPIVVYVSPSGARAGSAGVFITLASHIAAMAPGTNIGAAHPVSMGEGMDSTMVKKVTNDAVAFARSIAAQRNRDQDWAEAAVRESVSITDEDALEKGIIDVIAKDIDDLLKQINGRTVKLQEGEVVLNTEEYTLHHFQMSWRERFLNKLSDPNIAYILLMIGFYGLLFELYNPGSIFPGVIGGICLILAFFAMQTLPVNYAGLLLIIFAIVLFLLEIKVTSYGMLTIGGVVSLLLGSIMLFKAGALPSATIRVSWSVLLPIVGATILFFLIVITLGVRAQRRKPDYGEEAIMGKEALVIQELNPEGMVRVEGELWRASADEKHTAGETLFVLDREGMRLKVGRK